MTVKCQLGINTEIMTFEICSKNTENSSIHSIVKKNYIFHEKTVAKITQQNTQNIMQTEQCSLLFGINNKGDLPTFFFDY